MLTERQRFKSAFMARCIEQGITEPDYKSPLTVSHGQD